MGRLSFTLVTWCFGNAPLNIGLNIAVDILREKVEKQRNSGVFEKT